MRPSISVVLRTKNEARYLDKVLERLHEQVYEGPLEIILVDSGSTDETVAIAKRFGCTIIHVEPEEFSFGRSLNTGINRAGGEVIINLSGHSVPEKTDYFDRMVAPFEDSTVAATFGRDIPWDDACPSQARDILMHFPVRELDGRRFSNANAALRKSMWQRVRFDEALSASEDLLWAEEVIRLGYVIRYVFEAVVFHSHSPSLKYIERREYKQSRSVNSFAEHKLSFGLDQFMKFWIGHTVSDAAFALRNRYPLYWLLHIPLYRFSQSVGLYRGFRAEPIISRDGLDKAGQYTFAPRINRTGKKIILVTHAFYPESVGGTEQYTLSLAKQLLKSGWDAIVLSATRNLAQSRYKVTQCKYDGIDVIKINNPPEFCTRFLEYFIDHTVDRLFKRILLAEKPALIHFQHTAYLSARLPEIAFQLLIPSVFTLHDYWYMCYRSQLIRPDEGVCPGPSKGVYCATCYDPLHPNQGGVPRFPVLNRIIQLPIIRGMKLKERLSPGAALTIKRVLYQGKGTSASSGQSQETCPSPDSSSVMEHVFRMQFMQQQLSFPLRVISPSFHLKKRYEDAGFRQVIHLPHGFEPQERVARPPFDGRLVIAYLSNLVPFKGAHIVLDELALVKDRERVRILFYGRELDPAYGLQLKAKAQALAGADISFMGPYKGKNDLMGILSDVHLVVFPSIWEENHPLVVHEVLQHGVPLLCTSLGGAPEVIRDGVNGLLFDPYNRGELANRIERLLKGPELLEQITAGARATQIQSMKEHIAKIVALYHEVLNLPKDADVF